MLVERDDVEAQFLGVEIFVEVVVVIFGGLLAIEVAIGDPEVSADFSGFLLPGPSDRAFGEIS